MGLRDRGLVIDYYIPLFAGVEAAKRDRWRSRFLWGSLAPYLSGGGTNSPGGIAQGEGGSDTPIDPFIHTPVITSTEIRSVCDSFTSSPFESDVEQTHVASRWLVEKLEGEFLYAYVADLDGTISPIHATRQAACEIGAVEAYYAGGGLCFGTTDAYLTGDVCTLHRGTLPGCTEPMDVPINEVIIGTAGPPTGMFVFDSGPDSIHLTSYLINDVGLAPNNQYRVSVRYKGSDGGWSDWSNPQGFSLGPCTNCT